LDVCSLQLPSFLCFVYYMFCSAHHCNRYGDCRGSSRPDHILCSRQLTPFIQQSSVERNMVDSDHLPVDITFLFTVTHTSPPALQPPFPRLRWKGREREYVQAIRHMIQVGQFDKALQNLQVDDVNSAVEDFVFCIVQAAVESGHDIRAHCNNNHTSQFSSAHKPWFDHDCRLARKQYRRCGGYSFNARIHARNIYKSMIRKKQRAWQKQVVQQLIDDIYRNPRSFWSHFQTIRTFLLLILMSPHVFSTLRLYFLEMMIVAFLLQLVVLLMSMNIG
jgi:hypothetical protein